MPITVDIDGVGRVELDDSFGSMSSADQDAIIRDIVASSGKPQPAPADSRPVNRQGDIPSADAPAPMPEAPASNPDDQFYSYDENGNTISDDWFAREEAAYQDSLAKGAYPETQGKPPGGREQVNDGHSAMLGFADSLTFGFGDEIDAGLGAVLGGEGYDSIWSGKSFGDAYSANVDKNRELLKASQDEDPLSFLGGGLGSIVVPFGAAGSILRSGGDGVRKAIKAAETGAKVSKAKQAAKAAGAGAVYGGLYGVGTGEDTLEDRLATGAEYAGYGAVGGVVGDTAIRTVAKAMPKARAASFARKQIEGNDYAAYDAEIVEDLGKLVDERAVSKTDPKGRATLTAKQINSLETSYTAKIEEMLTKSDLPEPRKMKLKEAYLRRQSIPLGEVDALRGDVYGDALADGIIKVQRLRQLTPELKTKTGILTHTANALDFVPGVPGIANRGLRAIARASGDGEAARVNAADKLLSRRKAYEKVAEQVGPSGARESRDALWDAVEQTVTRKEAEAAQKALDTELNRFEREARPIVREKVRADQPVEDPIVTEGRAALKRRAAKLATGSENKLMSFDDKLDAPVKGPAEPTAKDMKRFRQEITDPAPDMRDLTNPVPDSDKALATRIQRRNAAVQKLEGNTADWDAALADPSTKPQPKASAEDPIDRMVERGIKGEFRALDSLANSTGMEREDAIRVLRAVAEDDPALAREVARVTAGHNTSTARMGPTLRPAMRAKMEELGITPKVADEAPSIPLDEAAQARLAKVEEATLKSEGVDVKNITPREIDLLTQLDEVDPVRGSLSDGESFRDSQIGMLDEEAASKAQAIRDELTTIREERSMRSVQRPQQWADGRARYQEQANDSIAAMQRDPIIGRESMDVIGNAPAQLRDNFKTTEEAVAYLNDRVLPDLEADGISAREIARIRNYLMEVAQAKPYATREAFEEGTRYRGPGRPNEK